MNANPELEWRLRLAIRLASQAARGTLPAFRAGNPEVFVKPDGSPVTKADRDAEAFLRDELAREAPDDAVLGEEFGARSGRSGFRWIVDPIDGTKSFVRGIPHYGTLVGVEHAGEAQIGVIVLPAIEEVLYAATGSGAWWMRAGGASVAARVSTVSTLREAFVSSGYANDPYGRQQFPPIERLAAAAKGLWTWGDCYGYALVATGRVDSMIDPEMNIWDCAALKPIVEEAGGRFTDWRGVPTIDGGNAVASNGKIHGELLALLR